MSTCGTNQLSVFTRERVVSLNVQKIVGLLVIALLIFFVLTRPEAAANSVGNILGMLKDAGTQVVSFITNVV